ncbi:MAG: HAD family hydrolase [Deltaproteobacteria bacterium]|nr:HAD family hydrolase [Deltaproteobacteria bacterium]MBI3078593.1 HAD family hydrolase [Deltaproteobacteria bacterium]
MSRRGAWHSLPDLQAVLFDYGGTLDGDGEHWFDRFVRLYAEAKLAVPLERLKEAFYGADDALAAEPETPGLTLRQLMGRHVWWQFRHLEIDDPAREAWLVERFCEASANALARNLRLLHRLRGRVRLGIISNFYGNLETICREFRLAPLLDVVVDSQAVGLRKPDPRIFHLALARLAVEPDRALFVGDSFERDILGARSAGLWTAWVVGPVARPAPEPGAVDVTVQSLGDLEKLVSRGRE